MAFPQWIERAGGRIGARLAELKLALRGHHCRHSRLRRYEIPRPAAGLLGGDHGRRRGSGERRRLAQGRRRALQRDARGRRLWRRDRSLRSPRLAVDLAKDSPSSSRCFRWRFSPIKPAFQVAPSPSLICCCRRPDRPSAPSPPPSTACSRSLSATSSAWWFPVRPARARPYADDGGRGEGRLPQCRSVLGVHRRADRRPEGALSPAEAPSADPVRPEERRRPHPRKPCGSAGAISPKRPIRSLSSARSIACATTWW